MNEANDTSPRSEAHPEQPVEDISSVCVIVNPAAGQDQPFLKTMNNLFKEAGVDYELLITKDAGDGRRLAQEAVGKGASVVAAYGGDGTVIEVASGLIDTHVPLAILPGGTGNMMAKAFGIPLDFTQACALIAENNAALRKVSLARIDDGYFFQLAGIGLEAKMVEGADREAKDRMGILAYGVAALQALANPETSHYHIDLDGESVEIDGVTCLISIVANLGFPRLSQALGSLDHPEELDIVVLERADMSTFLAVMATTATGAPPSLDTIHHWHSRHVTVAADPPQGVQADGEFLGEKGRLEVTMLYNAIEILVPAVSETAQTQEKG